MLTVGRNLRPHNQKLRLRAVSDFTMSKKEIRELTKAELEVMQILWDKGEAFVSELLEAMPEPRPAYNTVSTIVRILEKKGVVGYTPVGKSHRYRPLVAKEAYTRSFMNSVMSNFFDNSLSQMVSFFCEKEDLSVRETERILAIAREAIEKKKGVGGGSRPYGRRLSRPAGCGRFPLRPCGFPHPARVLVAPYSGFLCSGTLYRPVFSAPASLQTYIYKHYLTF